MGCWLPVLDSQCGGPSLLFPKGGTSPSTPDLTPTAPPTPDPPTPSLPARLGDLTGTGMVGRLALGLTCC